MFQVLIADDEKYIRRSIINRIDWKSCETEVIGEAANGREASEFAILHQPDIIISDIRMPEMDGLALAQMIAENAPQICIILISAYDDFAYAKRAIHYGVREYLLKPVDKEELEDTLKRITEERTKQKQDFLLSGLDARLPSEVKFTDVTDDIQSYVQQHFMEELTVGNLAKRFHLNAAYLSTIFKEKNKISLCAYIEEVRMEKAKKLLKYSAGNITEIALMSGYPDSNYFTKVFKKYTGMTPTQWKKANNDT